MPRWEAVDAPFLRPAKLTECTFLEADCLRSLEPYSSLIGLPTSIPNFEETPTIAIHQGGATEAAIDGTNETIDSLTNTVVDLVANWCPEGEMAVEQ